MSGTNGSKWMWPAEHGSYAATKKAGGPATALMDSVRKIALAKKLCESTYGNKEQAVEEMKDEIVSIFGLKYGMKIGNIQNIMRVVKNMYSDVKYKADFDAILAHSERAQASRVPTKDAANATAEKMEKLQLGDGSEAATEPAAAAPAAAAAAAPAAAAAAAAAPAAAAAAVAAPAAAAAATTEKKKYTPAQVKAKIEAFNKKKKDEKDYWRDSKENLSKFNPILSEDDVPVKERGNPATIDPVEVYRLICAGYDCGVGRLNNLCQEWADGSAFVTLVSNPSYLNVFWLTFGSRSLHHFSTEECSEHLCAYLQNYGPLQRFMILLMILFIRKKKKDDFPNFIFPEHYSGRVGEVFKKVTAEMSRDGSIATCTSFSEVAVMAAERARDSFNKKTYGREMRAVAVQMIATAAVVKFQRENKSLIPALAPLFVRRAKIADKLDAMEAVQDLYKEAAKFAPGSDDHNELRALWNAEIRLARGCTLLDFERMAAYGSFEVPVEPPDPDWGVHSVQRFKFREEFRLNYSKPFGGHPDCTGDVFRRRIVDMLRAQFSVDEIRMACWARLHHTGALDFSQCAPVSSRAVDQDFIIGIREWCEANPQVLVDVSRIRALQNRFNALPVANIWTPPSMPWVYLSSRERVCAMARVRLSNAFEDSNLVSQNTDEWLNRFFEYHKESPDAKRTSKGNSSDACFWRPADRAGRSVYEIQLLVEACANESHYERWHREDGRYQWAASPEPLKHAIPYMAYRRLTRRFEDCNMLNFGFSENVTEDDKETLKRCMLHAMKNNDVFCLPREFGNRELFADVGLPKPQCAKTRTVLDDPEFGAIADWRGSAAYMCEGVSYYSTDTFGLSGFASHALEFYASQLLYAIYELGTLAYPAFAAVLREAEAHIDSIAAPDADEVAADAARVAAHKLHNPKWVAPKPIYKHPRKMRALVYLLSYGELLPLRQKVPRAIRLLYYQMIGDVQNLTDEGVCPICLLDLREDDVQRGTFNECERCHLRGQFNRRHAILNDTKGIYLERIACMCAGMDEAGYIAEQFCGRPGQYEPAHVHATVLKVAAERGALSCDLATHNAGYRDEHGEYPQCKFVMHTESENRPFENFLRFVDASKLDGGEEELKQYLFTPGDVQRTWKIVDATYARGPQMVLLHAADSRPYVSREMRKNRIACLHHAMMEKRVAGNCDGVTRLTAAESFKQRMLREKEEEADKLSA